MIIGQTLFRFLSVLAVCGLTAAPMARSAIAVPASELAASMVDPVGAAATDDIPDDMPCCPKKVLPGCQDCPLMALCQAGAMNGPIGKIAPIVFSTSASLLQMLDEADFSGQGQGPPHRPPKA